MSIGKRFRRDLFYYLLGVIIPATINAITIPVLKQILGAAEFGIYGIRFNLFLLLVSFSIGWLSQCIIRFKFTVAGNETFFYRKIVAIAAGLLFLLAAACFCVSFWYYQNGLLFSLLFSVGFILCGFQNILIAISQANFLSKFTMYSEAVRTFTFFASAILLLKFSMLPSIDSIFLALIISYIISGIFLVAKNNLHRLLPGKSQASASFNFKTRQLFDYGLPLAAWFLVSYFIMFIEKPLLASNLGYETQGNYQALYELISKGAVIILIPVPYALFPLLTKAFETNDEKTGIRLLKKIILIEAGILVAALAAYWWFGYAILRYILAIPPLADYKWCGLVILASTIIWQIGILCHKPFELRKKTKTMLWIVLGALAVFLGLLFIIVNNRVGVVWYSVPFLGASVTYVFLCLLTLGFHKRMTAPIGTIKELVKEKI